MDSTGYKATDAEIFLLEAATKTSETISRNQKSMNGTISNQHGRNTKTDIWLKAMKMKGATFRCSLQKTLEKYFPEATRHANGQVEDWNERIMIPAMFAMIKAQKKKIDQQEKLINKLCEKLNIE